jgi:carboxyl-terminal processing protease
MKRVLQFLTALLMLAVVFGGGLALGADLEHNGAFTHTAGAPAPAATVSAQAAPDFKLIEEAWNRINSTYVDRSTLQSEALTYGAISGMVNALGDTGHSVFLTPEMRKAQSQQMQGSFEGIGAEVQGKNGQTIIVAPIDDSPARQAGLKAGDIIMKVDGVDVGGLAVDQVIAKILGTAGTKVTVTIFTPATGDTRDVPLVRARIVIKNVSWQMVPGTTTAHIRIAGFSQGVTNDLKKSLADIKQQGATGIILDLRNDPGGLLDEAVGVTSQFLAGGNVLLTKDAQGNTKGVPVKSGGAATDIPVVVLINQGTASASEIVSGAIQDAKRAQIVGETTFGTGTVLNQFPLSDGSAIMLAIQEWLTPNGRVIWHKGLAPDISVTNGAQTAPLTPSMEKSMSAADVQASRDAQLLRALSLLNGMAALPYTVP